MDGSEITRVKHELKPIVTVELRDFIRGGEMGYCYKVVLAIGRQSFELDHEAQDTGSAEIYAEKLRKSLKRITRK